MMPEPSNIRVRIAGATDVGLVREHNEDNYLIIDLDSGEADFSHLREYDLGKRGALLVVCDGMGGAAAGEVASQMAVQSMRQQLLPLPPPGPISSPGEPAGPGAGGATPAGDPAASPDKPDKDKPDKEKESELHQVARRLREAATRANQEIYEAACADVAKNGMGTTLTALMLLHSHVVVAQVGDSRAYIWRQGRLTQITHDQSLVNQLLDSGQITPEQAKLFEHSNVILQALGVQEDIEVILSSEVLRRDDRLLLCSDGLVGVVTDEEIQEVITNTENLEEGVQKLIDMARAGGGPDNITVILAQAFGEGVAAPTAEEQAQYRAMALDGDKPQERRTWSADYSYAGSTNSGRDLGHPSSASAGRILSPVSLLSMAAVLALAVTCLVVGLVLYPQRNAGNMVLCSVSTDQLGLQLGVDDKVAAAFTGLGVELKLPPGERRLWLVNPQDGGRHFGEQTVTVSAGQPCSFTLQGLGTIPAVAVDAAPADSGRLAASAAERDGGVVDAATHGPAPTGPDDAGEPEPAIGDSDTDPGTPGHKKRGPRKRRPHDKNSDLGAGGPTAPPPAGTDTPASPPDLASSAPAPVKPESKPVEPVAPEKPVPEKTPEKPADKPPAEKPAPAAEKPSAASAPAPAAPATPNP